jgi:CP family cyanate transporter-like MFS transporter
LNLKKGSTKLVGITVLVILLGLMMRSPITTIPLMISDLARELKVSAGSLGILTTLPLVMFMLFSNFASNLLKKLGFKKSLITAIIVILLGSLLRLVVTMPTMILGTSLIGMGIAYLNVFMPSFVAAYFSDNIGIYTTLYTFAMMFGSAIFNVVTAPVMAQTGWWSMLVVLLIVPVLAVIVGLFTLKRVPEKINRSESQPEMPEENIRIWTNRKAWSFLLAFGCQSVLIYTFTAWMPSLMAYHHVNPGIVGVIMACFSLMGLPVSILLPQALMRASRLGQQGMILSAGLAGLIASGMLFVQDTSATWFWLVESILLGYAVNMIFIFVMTMFAIKTASPYQTARLSGMAQAGGYFIAALGPSLYGIAFASHPTGIIQNFAYVGAVLIATIGALVITRIEKV